ncbi:unnamed protein product [Gemmataceae bacterium]|nr:unnamed protein product [Gemmataceae bacterium]VTU00636.1 unnamed protein product [Gemmataceae bacterium]
MKIYRLMKVAPDGLPLVGTKFGMLGVRPRDPANPKKRFDVPAAAPADPVQPGSGGLSVNTDPAALKPPDDEFVLWEVTHDALGSGLRVTPDGPPHYVIEVAGPTTLDEMQRRIAETREHWKRVQ